MTENFESNIVECHKLLDSIASMTGIATGTTQSIVSEYTVLNTDNARLKAEKEILKRDNNRLKRWIAKIN